MKVGELWIETTTRLEKKIGKEAFDMWFRPVAIESVIGNEVRLITPNRFIADRIKECYADVLHEVLAQVTQDDVALKFTIRETGEGGPTPQALPPHPQFQTNPRYTFENFVGGVSNQFALAAALRVAERPGEAYNPLFIYGDVGLGKTHLLHSVGNAIAKKHPPRHLLYTTTEKFVNEFVNSIRHDRMVEFRKRYRTVDVLLVDDIQFIAGKEQTQDEFFHTLNMLYDANHQIVITSDRLPREMEIEERLRSRFEMGLKADIQPPDLETRMAILKKKADQKGLRLPDKAVEFIAATIQTNVRELEGVLTQLEVIASVRGCPITLDLAKERLHDQLAKRRSVTADDIQQVVADHFHVRLADLRAKRRTKSIVYPRHLAMYLCRRLTQLSLPDIGRTFGGKDHSTVIHATRQIAKKVESDASTRALIDDLIKKIEG